MRGERGSALVQVLVMSVLLVILATGVLKVMYMNHVVVTKVQRDDRYRAVAEACLAQKMFEWGTGGCVSGSCPSVNGLTASVSCPGGQPRFTVTSTWDN